MADRPSCRIDKSTQSSLEDFTFKHLVLALNVDFEARTLSGTATWTVTVARSASWLVLDTSAGLTVRDVWVCGARVEHTMRPPHAAFGVACAIPIPEALREVGRELIVKMEYTTAPVSGDPCPCSPPVRRRAHRQVHVRGDGGRSGVGDGADERGEPRGTH
jgi:aminopeptidase N